MLTGLIGFAAGVVVTLLYNLAHGAQVAKLGEEIKTELALIKSKIKI